MSLKARIICGLLLVVCSALPGAFLAWSPFDRRGIVAGVAVYATIWLFVLSSGAFGKLMENSRARRAFQITVVAKAILSTVIPVLAIADMFIGLFILDLLHFDWDTTTFFGSKPDFGRTFAVVLLHGFVVSAYVVGLYFVIYRVLPKRWIPQSRDGHCVRCGYDLRGTPSKCPECGEIVKNDPQVGRLAEAAADQSPAA